MTKKKKRVWTGWAIVSKTGDVFLDAVPIHAKILAEKRMSDADKMCSEKLWKIRKVRIQEV